MTPSDRADRARELLENVVFKEAFAELRESLVRRLEVSTAPDEQRELAVSLRILKQIRAQVEKLAESDAVDKYRIRQDTYIAAHKQRIPP